MLSVLVLVSFKCMPDEPRYWVRYRSVEHLPRGKAGKSAVAECFPVSASEITFHYDRIAGTTNGHFRFRVEDDSVRHMSADRKRLRFAVPRPKPDWWPASLNDRQSNLFTFYRCRQYAFALDEAAGAGYFQRQ